MRRTICASASLMTRSPRCASPDALDLYGDLAGILALASNAKQPSGHGAGGLQVSMVAGAGLNLRPSGYEKECLKFFVIPGVC
jgi:hypothetical protein